MFNVLIMRCFDRDKKISFQIRDQHILLISFHSFKAYFNHHFVLNMQSCSIQDIASWKKNGDWWTIMNLWALLVAVFVVYQALEIFIFLLSFHLSSICRDDNRFGLFALRLGINVRHGFILSFSTFWNATWETKFLWSPDYSRYANHHQTFAVWSFKSLKIIQDLLTIIVKNISSSIKFLKNLWIHKEYRGLRKPFDVIIIHDAFQLIFAVS